MRVFERSKVQEQISAALMACNNMLTQSTGCRDVGKIARRDSNGITEAHRRP